MVGEKKFYAIVRVFFGLLCVSFLSYFAVGKVQATSGTFTISAPLRSGDVFGFTGSGYSPTITTDSASCVLFFASVAVSTNDTCFPSSPDFVWPAGSGSYYVVTSFAGDTWTSNTIDYVAPTPEPTATSSATITPVYVDIASESALAVGIHNLGETNLFLGGTIIFWLIVLCISYLMRLI